jgi:hypothetical protein
LQYLKASLEIKRVEHLQVGSWPCLRILDQAGKACQEQTLGLVLPPL